MSFFATEFRPFASFGYTRVDGFANDGGAHPTCGFNFFAVFESVGDDGFGAVFVGGDGLWGKGGGVVEFFVVGPRRAAVRAMSVGGLCGVIWRDVLDNCCFGHFRWIEYAMGGGISIRDGTVIFVLYESKLLARFAFSGRASRPK